MTLLEVYLIKASISMSLFYTVYWIFLRKETTFSVNRFYLLITLVSSLIIPLITIHYQPANENAGVISSFSDLLPLSGNESSEVSFLGGLRKILMIVYYSGVVVFLFRILWQAYILLSLTVRNGIKRYENTRVVENERFMLPFSFLKIVFINPNHIRKNELNDIIAHEKVHIRENHWFDLLLVETITVFLWFNPFIWFFERSIKQNHEYLADEGVIAQGNSVGRYHSVLINQLLGMEVIGITNNLNYSLNAKRLKMMKRKKTPGKRALHVLWALPVAILLLAAFAQPEAMATDNNKIATISKTVKLICGVYDKNGDPIPGAVAVVKGNEKGVTTNDKGIFEIKVDIKDIVIVKSKGYEKNVIYMEKVVAKNGKSDEYKLKVKLLKSSEKEIMKPNGANDEVKKLEMMLKELSKKQQELGKLKEKIAAAEKEGEIDPEKLAEKKASIKKDYKAVSEKMEKVKAKLKAIKK